MKFPEIGESAYRAVMQMAQERGTSVKRECDRLGMWQPYLYKWKHGIAPGAEWLLILHRAGYNVVEILEGKS